MRQLVMVALLAGCGLRKNEESPPPPSTSPSTTVSYTTTDTGPFTGPPITEPPAPTGDTGTPSSTGETAWWVDTGDSGAQGTVTTPTESGDSGWPTNLDDDSGGFFTDSGGPGCLPVPNLDTGLPTTRDLGLSSDTGIADADGDGFPRSTDCDDLDPYVFPGAPERCDGVDTDCDPTTGEEGLVTVDGVDTYEVLADAVRGSSAGSTVVVCPGVHEGPIWVKHDLRIVGREGPQVTTLVSTATGPNLVRVQRGNVQIDGLTITGGDVDGATIPTIFSLYFGAPELPFWPTGAGLSLGDCGSLVVRGAVVTGNEHYASGGGVASGGAPLLLIDTEVVDNVAGRHGGGVFLTDEAECVLDEVLLSDNVAASGGGGLSAMRAGPMSGTGLWVEGNEALEGGGVQAFFGDLELPAESTLVGNVAERGGGLYAAGAAVSLSDGVVSGNVATAEGGGVYLFDSSLSDGRIEANQASVGGGLAMVSAYDASWNTLERLDVVGNEADDAGGLWLRDLCEADEVVLTGNEAAVAGGLRVDELGYYGLVGTSMVVDGNVGGDAVSTTSGGSQTYAAPASFACNGLGCTDGIDPAGVLYDEIETAAWPGLQGPLVASGDHVVVTNTLSEVQAYWADGTGGWAHQVLTGGQVSSFGEALALDGDRLVVGYPKENQAAGYLGAVAIYEHDGVAWSEVARFEAPVPQAGMAFGRSVALHGEMLAVGAPEHDTAYGIDAGSVFVYAHDGAGTWALVATLEGDVARAEFGAEVALSDRHVAVSSPYEGVDDEGAVRLYDTSYGGLLDHVVGTRVLGWLGAGSLALGDDVLAAPVAATTAGAAQVELYDLSGDRLVPLGTLDDPTDYPTLYGMPDVAMEGSTLVVGVRVTNHYGPSVGMVHRYDDVRALAQPVSMANPAREASQQLGWDVALSGEVVYAIGYHRHEVGRFSPDPATPAW